MKYHSFMNDSSFAAERVAADPITPDHGVVFAGARRAHAPGPHVVGVHPPSRPLSEPALEHDTRAFFDWLCGARGVRSDRYRASVVRRRQAACLRAAGCTSFAAARSHLEKDPSRLDRTLSAVLIGVTSFFRDGAPFEALASTVLDPSWRRKDEVRVLSVGCSEGHELYSAGIVLGEAGLLDRASLLGVDCRADAVTQARRGVFAGAALDAVPSRFRDRWFTREGAGFRVVPELHARTRWQVGDAFAWTQPASLDIIMCRNVAIYLRPESSAMLWANLAAMLRPAGLLMVGKAERPQPTLSLVKIAPCLYQSREVHHR